MTGKKKIILPLLAAVIVIASAAYFLLKPEVDVSESCAAVFEDCINEAKDNLINLHPAIAEVYKEQLYVTDIGNVVQSFRNASCDVKFHQLDIYGLTKDIAPEMQERLKAYVETASRPSDVYDGDMSFLPEVFEQAYLDAVGARLEKADEYCLELEMSFKLKYSDGAWTQEDKNYLVDILSAGHERLPGFEEACAQIEYIEFTYKLPDRTSPGPVPDETCYGETDDPAVLAALLETETAQKLINGQTLDWNPDKELIPGTTIRYYMDETILSIVWQEVEHGAVGTFAETFIADASQLRRKLADDTFGGQTFYYPTELAKQSNAVLALSGDFYDLPDRVYGLYVYDGQLLRSCLTAGQSCLFTDRGDMLFTYENQFATEQEAQDYITDNNVMFSLSFGPVMVENGVDVTPYDYPLGEVRDTYARCAVGQLGERHYLSMTINCKSPDYYVYVTLRQAADSMIEHGCVNAYTLDGGQTGSIIIGGELINPVQFGVERLQSDIFYFATAIPNE